MQNYARVNFNGITTGRLNRLVTPQSEKAQEDQVFNRAGGAVFQLNPLKRVERFLILGSEGNTYYATGKELSQENAKNLADCWNTSPKEVVELICDVARNGRAPKMDPVIFALALGAASKNPDARRLALDFAPEVCTIGTHILTFVSYVSKMRGWGRGLRKAVANWYVDKNPEKLAFQMLKYQNRSGWTHTDVLRMVHAMPPTPAHSALFSYVIHGVETHFLPNIVEGYEKAKRANTAGQIAMLIDEYKLPREMVPTQWLKSDLVWDALVRHMPLIALTRNLGNLSKCGLLTDHNFEVVNFICDKLVDEYSIKASKIHPIQFLTAYRTYKTGEGYRGKGTWQVSQKTVDALNEGFYRSFKNVEPSGKRFYLGLDVSGSMGSGEIAGVPGLTPREATGAMAMVTARAERNYIVRGFTGPDGFAYTRHSEMTDLRISPNMTLEQVTKEIYRQNFGTTDCALPMIDAMRTGAKIDVFVIYTDNETWAGKIHPYQALRDYRQKTGIDAKLIVVGMTATEFSIADPNDRGMLDVVGFDSAAPQMISDFARGSI